MTQDIQPQTSQTGRRSRAKLLAATLLLGALAVGGTVAYTTTQVEADNVITFGSVKMRVVQSERGEDGGLVELDPSQYDINAPMGQLERRVCVENLGSEPAYVRVKLDMHVERADDTEEDATDYRQYGLNLIDPESGAGATDEFKVGWTAGEDGWYYYNAPLAANATTEPLVTSIELINDFNGFAGQLGKYVFTADGQAVQSEYNRDSALTAEGWPAEDETEGQTDGQSEDGTNEGSSDESASQTTNDEGQE